MLVRQGSVYHYRRAVPARLRPIVGKSELWCSLGTASATAARAKAGMLYAAVERYFTVAKKLADLQQAPEDEERAVLQGIADEALRIAELTEAKAAAERHAAELRAVMAEARHAEELSAVVRRVTTQGLQAAREAAEAAKAQLRGRELAEATAAEARRSGEQAQTIAAHLAAAAAVVQAQVRLPGALASTLVEDHMRHRLEVDRITHQVANQERGTLARFFEVVGDRPIDSYGRADVSKFIAKLRKMPAVYGRSRADDELTMDQLIARADASNGPRLSDKTVKRHVSALSRFLQFAVDEGHLSATAKVEAIHAHRFRLKGAAADKRDAWTADELVTLFGSPVWTGCHRVFRMKPGEHVIRDAKFWIPLLALYHGARLEEFADLYRRDLRLDGLIWAIDIQPSEVMDAEAGVVRRRRLKNFNSARTVPVHPELIRLGFLEYVERVAPRSNMPLFPDLEPQGADGKRGPRFTRWFVEYRKAIGVYREGVGAHAFRHTAITRLTDEITNYRQKRIRDYLMGHAPNEVVTSETEGDMTYDKGRGLEMCAATLALLQYPELNLSHLYVR